MEQRLQWPMLVAALLVVPAIAIEQSEASGTLNTVAVVINWATWLAFLAEAVLMLAVVDNRRRWIRDQAAISGYNRDTLRAQQTRNPCSRAKAPTGIEPV